MNNMSFDSDENMLKKISSLKRLENKDELLKKGTTIKHGIFILLDILEKEWYPYRIEEYWYLIAINFSNGKRKLIYDSDYWFNSSSIRRIFKDKIYTTKILRHYGEKVADDMLVVKESSAVSNESNNIQACLEFAEKVWYPLIFKPNNGSRGEWVKKIFSQKQLLQELKLYNNDNKDWFFLLQQYLPGTEYRAIYLDGEVLVAYKREPISIKWDGTSSIKELISIYQYDVFLEEIKKYLTDQEVSLDTVLTLGEEISLLPTANVSMWWKVSVVPLSEEDIVFIKKIADIFWANYFWIDIISEWSIAEGTVLEINGAPGIAWISSVLPWFQEKFATIIRNKIKNI